MSNKLRLTYTVSWYKPQFPWPNKRESEMGKNLRWTEKKLEIYFKNAEVIKHAWMKQINTSQCIESINFLTVKLFTWPHWLHFGGKGEIPNPNSLVHQIILNTSWNFVLTDNTLIRGKQTWFFSSKSSSINSCLFYHPFSSHLLSYAISKDTITAF